MSIDLTTGIWPVTLLTGGPSGKVRRFSASSTPHHYAALPGAIRSTILQSADTDGSNLASGQATSRVIATGAVTDAGVAGGAVSGTQVLPACYSTQEANASGGAVTWSDAVNGGTPIPANTTLANGAIIYYNTGSISYGYPPAANPRVTTYLCPASGSVTCLMRHVAFAGGGGGTVRVNFAGSASGAPTYSSQTSAVSGSQNVSWSGSGHYDSTTGDYGPPYTYRSTNGTAQSYAVTTAQGPSTSYPIQLALTSVTCPSDSDGSSSLTITLKDQSGTVIPGTSLTIVSGTGTQTASGITGVRGPITVAYEPATPAAAEQYTWTVQAIASNGAVVADVPYGSSYTATFSGTASYWVSSGASGNTYILAGDGATQRLSALDSDVAFTQLTPDTVAFKVYNSSSSPLAFSIGVDVCGV